MGSNASAPLGSIAPEPLPRMAILEPVSVAMC